MKSFADKAKPLSNDLVQSINIESEKLVNKTTTILVVLILVSIFSILFSRKVIVQPINIMNSAVDDLRDGDGDLTYRLPDLGNDEIGQTAKSLNGFMEKIQNILIEVNAG